MPELPTDWSALCALVFLLGLRHGFDADHLAAIDGLTRLAAQRRARHARWCGALFSLGHGLVVAGIAAAVGMWSTHWDAPAWLDAFGAWVSIGFLLALGIVNLRAVLAAPAGAVVPLVGVRAPLLRRLLPGHGVWAAAAVGALFAASFDTVSQAALFAMTAAQFGGVAHSLMLALLFVAGMLVADGVNGWWIARLIARADQIAALASRVMGLAVAGVSIVVGAFGLAKLVSPSFDGWTEGRELGFGCAVIGAVAASYVLARVLARAPTRRGPDDPASGALHQAG